MLEGTNDAIKRMVAEASYGAIREFPTDLLVGVLQHVDQQQRLQCCALVCRKWRQAVNIATRTVVATRNSDRCLRSLSVWLSSNTNVGRLQSIRVKHKSWPRVAPALQLPFQQLRAVEYLRLPSCHLLAAPEDAAAFTAATSEAGGTAHSATTSVAGTAGQWTSLAAMPALSRLRLSNTRLSLSELGSCVGLQRLELYHVCHTTAGPMRSAQERTWCQLVVALPQLTQLTYLYIKHHVEVDYEWPSSVSSTLRLSSLRRLQELRISVPNAEVIAFSNMSSSLTSLLLALEEDLETEQSLMQLTQVQRLQLAYAWEPALVQSLTNLTYLCVRDRTFDTPSEVVALMTTLQRLTQLRHLNLAHCFSPSQSGDLPGPATYAALTASEYLTLLDIRDCWLPAGIAEHIFPAAGTLKDMKDLSLPSTVFEDNGSLEKLVACCPALEQLRLLVDTWMLPHEDQLEVGFYANGQELSALTQLSALTKLVLELHLNDDAYNSIAACSGLRELRLDTAVEDVMAPVTVASILHLSRLTGLTKLNLNVDCIEEAFSEQVLVSKSATPDVYLQLQQLVAGELDSDLLLSDDDHSNLDEFECDTEYEPVSEDSCYDAYVDDDDGYEEGSDD